MYSVHGVGFVLAVILLLVIIYILYRLYNSDLLNPPSEQLNEQLAELDLQHEDAANELLIRKRVGKKKQEKMQQKHEMRRQRLIEQSEREQARQRQEEEEERYRLQRQKEIEEERRKDQENARQAEIKERQMQEEYSRWKEHFKTLASGRYAPVKDAVEIQISSDLVSFAKERKQVLIREVASHFGISDRDCRLRLTRLIDDSQIVGYFDGDYFVYVTPMEVEKLITFIDKKGSFTKEEFCQECLKIINLVE
ncbi:hypothetical protein P9112_009319 [Eukaryota sp. TZLM1-RC]